MHKQVASVIHKCRAHDCVWVMTPAEETCVFLLLTLSGPLCELLETTIQCVRSDLRCDQLLSSSGACRKMNPHPSSLLFMRVSKLLPIGATESINDWLWFSLSYVTWQRQGILNLVCVKVHFCFNVLRICKAISSVDVIVKKVRYSFTASELQLIFELKTRVVHS